MHMHMHINIFLVGQNVTAPSCRSVPPRAGTRLGACSLASRSIGRHTALCGITL